MPPAMPAMPANAEEAETRDQKDLTRHKQDPGPNEKEILPAGQTQDQMGSEEEGKGKQTGQPREPEGRGLYFDDEPQKPERQQEGRDHGVREEPDDPLGPVHGDIDDIGPGDVEIIEQRREVRGLVRVTDAHRLLRGQREQLPGVYHVRNGQGLVHHRLRNRRIEPLGLGERAHFTPHRGDDLLGSLRTCTIHRRRGADDRSRPHVDATGRQRDQSTRREGSTVHEGINGHARIGNRVGDALGRIDASTRSIDIENDDTDSRVLSLTDGTLDERCEPHFHDTCHGHPEHRGDVLCMDMRRPAQKCPKQ